MNRKSITNFRRWLYLLLIAYAFLLIVSHLKRSLSPVEVEPAESQQLFTARGFGKDSGKEMGITYLDYGPPDGIPLLLVHGSPVGSSVFNNLVKELPNDFRIIAPDLPGHGHSTVDVSDGSFLADADYLHQLLEHLGLSSVNVVAYSRGGGPALQLIDQYPESVQSLVLLSSIGVQELELLGNYTLNHALHKLQYALLVLIEELTPHFGYLDNAILNSDYARSFADADQRPLREIMEAVDVPTLILHGKNDAFVPLAAAKEHHRIIPHSESKTISGGHIVLVQKAGEVAHHIEDFARRSESGIAKVRGEASPERLLQAVDSGSAQTAIATTRGGLLFLSLIIILATFVTEDFTCIIAGILAAAGTIPFWVAVSACFIGIFVGDLIIFYLGRWFGAKAVRRAPLRYFLTEERLAFATTWFERRGATVIITSRFIPGTRLPIYFAAGTAHADTAKFLFYFFIATAIWTPLLVGLATLLGNPILQFFSHFEEWALPGLIGLILFIAFLLRYVVPLFTHRGRRLIYGRWKRKVRWEFWPRWIFYPPVVLWVIWLGIRFRRPSLFTASNPAMEAGGIAFESKTVIDRELRKGAGQVAKTLALSTNSEVEKKVEDIRAFQQTLSSPFPLVLKPDFGERGDGVRIVSNEEELETVVNQDEELALAQEFIPGLEFGVFFEKAESEKTGRVTSITRKIHTSVLGDGRRTLDELILDDPRAVLSYPYFRKAHRHRLITIPEEGETVELATLGSHCRGSLFLDGQDLLTPSLTKAINKIFEGTSGLCFGRMDVKCPNEDDFRSGENIVVLEFNGVTSESTHIYDPTHSLWYAYRVIFSQWKRAFNVADLNEKAGAERWSSTRTLRLLWRALLGIAPEK
ncbi:MAG: alpha/beta fold hydrolase [Verrucomicrobiota bacterium]